MLALAISIAIHALNRDWPWMIGMHARKDYVALSAGNPWLTGFVPNRIMNHASADFFPSVSGDSGTARYYVN